MTEELANIDLLKGGPDGHGTLAHRSRRLLGIVAFLALVIVVLGGTYWYLRRARSAPAAAVRWFNRPTGMRTRIMPPCTSLTAMTRAPRSCMIRAVWAPTLPKPWMATVVF